MIMNETIIKDWAEGTPSKSGSYIVKSKRGVIGRDDYSAEKGIWWNYDVEFYSPSSFKEL